MSNDKRPPAPKPSRSPQRAAPASAPGAKPAPGKQAGVRTGAKGPDAGAPKSGGTTNPAGDRIAKVLARAGVASRREAERMVEEGRITVNGLRIDSPALNVTARDKILVDGQPLAPPEPARLWLYHKPTGLVTSERDEKGRETVFETLPPDMPRVMSVGRLDINSEGLLLLTNDGGLKRRLELPSTGWLRKYRVRVNGRPVDADLAPLREGIVVEGERFQPMVVAIDRQQGANAWLTIGIREGRNREVRRAMEHVGMVVNRLIRISYGPFQLGPLAVGAVEEVKSRVLRDQLGEGADLEGLNLLGETDTAAHRRPAGRAGAKPGPGPKAGAAKGAMSKVGGAKGSRPGAASTAPQRAATGPAPGKGKPGKGNRGQGTGHESATDRGVTGKGTAGKGTARPPRVGAGPADATLGPKRPARPRPRPTRG
ncbi:pseudouridine synthase [Roseicitreum antarcticum]|uniref:Pseudouridine synthase n=1 Tax=Roseicitreum antarcticum TaxID=564137 RepID=A0A1H2U5G5_9RHOB|nr:pseudouridine synthase [Roseicitreum antarcticum]SDW51177.1 23S rRNA pseudouridine2605 synthase [Roseicitreum antarcticum]